MMSTPTVHAAYQIRPEPVPSYVPSSARCLAICLLSIPFSWAAIIYLAVH